MHEVLELQQFRRNNLNEYTTMPEASAKKAEKPHTYGNYINGRQVKAETGETFASYNPAKTDEVIGYFAASTPKDVKDAVDAAAKAFPAWKRTPAPHRAEILLKAAHLLREPQRRVGPNHDSRNG
jgi:delta 1-pyrroline-5-carboxylate dehydrogenase